MVVDLNQFRPQPLPAQSPNVRKPTGPVVTPTGERKDVADLLAVPGSPNYYAKIPPPEPDGTSREYGGRRKEDVERELAADLFPPPGQQAVPQAVTQTSQNRRVGVYCGRGDDFILAVETAPDWDAERSWRLSPATVLALLPVLRALEVKVKDATGGELDALRAAGD